MTRKQYILRQTCSALLLTLAFFTYWQTVSAATPASDKGIAAGKNAPSDNEVAGIVLDKIGEWSITKGKDTRSIVEGDSIADGWTLKQKTSDGTISVLLNNGKVMKCPDINGACLSPIRTAKPTSWYDNLVRTAMRLVTNDPDRFVAAISRDVDGLVLSDGVVQQEGSKIDLSSITKDLPAGKYAVELIKQNSDSGKNVANLSCAFEVKAHKLNKLSLPGLESDVYRLQITSQQEPNKSASAYIYVAQPGQYPVVQQKFSAFVSSVMGAQQELNGAGHSIVRAFIFAFAEKDSSAATD